MNDGQTKYRFTRNIEPNTSGIRHQPIQTVAVHIVKTGPEGFHTALF